MRDGFFTVYLRITISSSNLLFSTIHFLELDTTLDDMSFIIIIIDISRHELSIMKNNVNYYRMSVKKQFIAKIISPQYEHCYLFSVSSLTHLFLVFMAYAIF